MRVMLSLVLLKFLPKLPLFPYFVALIIVINSSDTQIGVILALVADCEFEEFRATCDKSFLELGVSGGILFLELRVVDLKSFP